MIIGCNEYESVIIISLKDEVVIDEIITLEVGIKLLNQNPIEIKRL